MLVGRSRFIWPNNNSRKESTVCRPAHLCGLITLDRCQWAREALTPARLLAVLLGAKLENRSNLRCSSPTRPPFQPPPQLVAPTHHRRRRPHRFGRAGASLASFHCDSCPIEIHLIHRPPRHLHRQGFDPFLLLFAGK